MSDNSGKEGFWVIGTQVYKKPTPNWESDALADRDNASSTAEGWVNTLELAQYQPIRQGPQRLAARAEAGDGQQRFGEQVAHLGMCRF